MTQDFREDFVQSLDKEGYEYLIITFKDLNIGAHTTSSLGDLNEVYKFQSGKVVTKRESLKELINGILDEVL